MKKCALCGNPAYADVRETVTWEQRTARGLRRYARRETGRVACDECAAKMRDGVAIGQGTFTL